MRNNPAENTGPTRPGPRPTAPKVQANPPPPYATTVAPRPPARTWRNPSTPALTQTTTPPVVMPQPQPGRTYGPPAPAAPAAAAPYDPLAGARAWVTQAANRIGQAAGQATTAVAQAFSPQRTLAFQGALRGATATRPQAAAAAVLKFAAKNPYGSNPTALEKAAADRQKAATSPAVIPGAKVVQQYEKELETGLRGPNWTRGDYVPPVDYRMGEGAKIQMTADEYLRRRDAWLKMFSPSYNEWLTRATAVATSNQNLDRWLEANPQPGGFLQTQQEWQLRQNAAPPGMTYVPFGSSYIQTPQLPTPPASQPASGGGGGYGYGDYGGGGHGYTPHAYAEALREFYNSMVSWGINQPQGG